MMTRASIRTGFLPVRQANPDGTAAAIMLAFLATAGLFYVNIMPAIVDGLIQGLGFSNEAAGLVASINVYGASAGALAASFLVHRLSWKPTAVGLLVALIAVDLLSMMVDSVTGLTALRFVDGLIGGFLVGIGFSVIARTRNPDRVFGVLLVVQFGLGGIGLMILPQFVKTLGTPILFAALILVSLTTLLMLPFLDDYRVPPPHSVDQAPESPPGPTVSLRLIAPTLLGIFLFQAANMGVAAYIIPLGEAAGLPRDFISPVLGMANWIGLLGSGLVIVLSHRTGRLSPLVGGLIVTFIGLLAFLLSSHGSVYALANGITSITWSLVIPYLFGMCATFDRTGRFAVLGSFSSKIGLASGPLIAGYLTRNSDFSLLIWIAAAATLIATTAVIAPALSLDRNRTHIRRQ